MTLKKYTSSEAIKVTALAGGVGGAKLVEGLANCLPDDFLKVIVNTGDDFIHYGLKICPDLDTVCYTLAGMANPVTGWGRSEETWCAITAIENLGGPTWFRLGDLDLGTHLERSRRLNEGQSLSKITKDFCRAWGINLEVLPMSDDNVPTVVSTHDGKLSFQEYFVKYNCQPKVTGFTFENIESAQPAPGVLKSIKECDIVVLCPSNPWVSIDPILSVPGVRSCISRKPVIAVSPIIGGKAVRGPAAKMYEELGINPSAYSIAQHYQDLLTAFVYDQIDSGLEIDIHSLGVKTKATDTLMKNKEDRFRLAREVIEYGTRILV